MSAEGGAVWCARVGAEAFHAHAPVYAIAR